ncbi:MAG: hypothetical protein PHD95_04225 [Candidatus ainarchaeum sp.]|nr:hypothetical protein [Candidatus ainarchaeum sp.]
MARRMNRIRTYGKLALRGISSAFHGKPKPRHTPRQMNVQELPEAVQNRRTLIIKFLSREATHSDLVLQLANSFARQPRQTWVYEGTDVLLVTGNENMDLFLEGRIEKIDSLQVQINKTLKDPEWFDRMETKKKLGDRILRNKAAHKMQKELDKEKRIVRDALYAFLIKNPQQTQEKQAPQ